MKKVLGLLFISASIFSMQVATIGNQCERAKKFHDQLVKHHFTKPDMSRKDIKQQAPKLNIDIKDCIQSKSVSAPKGLGEIKLFHNEKGFHVLHNDVMHRVQPCFTDKLVRRATSHDIKDFQRKGKGYFALTQMGDGQFELKVLNRTLGGGPILGVAVYWAVKVTLYAAGAVGIGAAAATGVPAVVGAVGAIAGGTGAATIVAGASTAIAASAAEGALIATVSTVGATTLVTAAGAVTAPVILTTTAGILTAAAGTTVAAAGTATGLAAAATVGASLGGATVAGVALADAAALGTAVVVSHATATAGVAGGAALIVGGIEAIAAAAGAFCGMLPTP